MYTSPHGQNNWSGVGTAQGIPDEEKFQTVPVRFNFGTVTSPDYKYFLVNASGSGAIYTSSDGVSWNRTATLSNNAGAENAPSKIGDTLYSGTYYEGILTQ